jgi:hypothetical protein
MMHTHSPNTACQKADDKCFLGWERSADGGIHAKRDNSNVRSVHRNIKKLQRDIQKKRPEMQTSGVVLFHDNALPNTTARTRALLEYFNWVLFD